MKCDFTFRSLNSPFDDSAFFVRNVYKKRAFLFDCGRLGTLDNSELLDIEHVFVTHTHIDHFAGFDRFLRGCLNSGNTIHFYGPSGFIGNIEGRLASYNWNLIRDYSLIITANELTPEGCKSAIFSASEGFIKQEADNVQDEIDIGDGFKLKYEFFDHGGITSIGYRVKEPLIISVLKNKLSEYGFIGGSWIKDLKQSLLENKDKKTLIKTQTKDGEKFFPLGQLSDMISVYKKPQDITYITDIAPTYENYCKAVDFANNSFLLVIEAVFLKEDIYQSIIKNHLTVDLARNIFFNSHSDFIRFHHFAPRYDKIRDIFFKSLNKNISSRIFL